MGNQLEIEINALEDAMSECLGIDPKDDNSEVMHLIRDFAIKALDHAANAESESTIFSKKIVDMGIQLMEFQDLEKESRVKYNPMNEGPMDVMDIHTLLYANDLRKKCKSANVPGYHVIVPKTLMVSDQIMGLLETNDVSCFREFDVGIIFIPTPIK